MKSVSFFVATLVVVCSAQVPAVAADTLVVAVQADQPTGLVACDAYVIDLKTVTGPLLKDRREASELRSLASEFAGLDVRIIDQQTDGTIRAMFTTRIRTPLTLIAEIATSPSAGDVATSRNGTYFLRAVGSCERWRPVGHVGLALTAKLTSRPSKTSTDLTASGVTDCARSAGAEVVYAKTTLSVLFYETEEPSNIPSVLVCTPYKFTVTVKLQKPVGGRRLVLLTDFPNRP